MSVPKGKRHSRVDFHSWRRFFISEARNLGHDLTVIAAIAGTERSGMTDGTYSGSPTTEMKQAAVEAVQLPREHQRRAGGPAGGP